MAQPPRMGYFLRMSEFLLYYRRPDPITWVYMSSFLTLGLFFVFRRFWSIRNLDVILLICFAPGLLMVQEGYRREAVAVENLVTMPVDSDERIEDPRAAPPGSQTSTSNGGGAIANEGVPGLATTIVEDGPSNSVAVPQLQSSIVGDASTLLMTGDVNTVQELQSARRLRLSGFIALFFVEFLLMIRMLLDPMMVRRPLLDPNLTTGGLNFIAISLFIFMMANVVASTPEAQQEQGPRLGPGYALINMLPALPTRPVATANSAALDEAPVQVTDTQRVLIAKTIAILGQTAVLVGMLLIGSHHFGNLRAGAGCVMLYLLSPYTAQMTGRVDHVVPAAMMVWAILMYHRPLIAGMFVGAAAGLVYYPLFLLPLWIGFYWQRGGGRFGIGVIATLTVLTGLLVLAGGEPFFLHLRRMFGLFMPTWNPQGVWEVGWNPVWRLPVIVGFVILSFFLATWPTNKNLGSLISCSAALMVAAQFWHGYGGGLYMSWFLPLVLLTMYRPNLQDRVALRVIDGPTEPRTPRATMEMDAA